MIISDTYAIFWREMKRYRKSKSGVIIRLIQPAIWIVVMKIAYVSDMIIARAS